MSNVTRFPPKLSCPLCQIPLRPATREEINLGLRHSNPTIRQAYAHAVQGNSGKKFIVDDSFTENAEWDTPPGTWVMHCPNCDHVTVHMVEEPSVED